MFISLVAAAVGGSEPLNTDLSVSRIAPATPGGVKKECVHVLIHHFMYPFQCLRLPAGIKEAGFDGLTAKPLDC